MSEKLRTPAEVAKEGGDMTQEEFNAWMEAIRKTNEWYENATIDDMYIFTDSRDPKVVELLYAQAERENKILVLNMKETPYYEWEQQKAQRTGYKLPEDWKPIEPKPKEEENGRSNRN